MNTDGLNIDAALTDSIVSPTRVQHAPATDISLSDLISQHHIELNQILAYLTNKTTHLPDHLFTMLQDHARRQYERYCQLVSQVEEWHIPLDFGQLPVSFRELEFNRNLEECANFRPVPGLQF